MYFDLIRIGNSQGIRIPKPILEQCGFKKGVILQVEDNRIILRPFETVRSGWEASFQAMAEAGDDKPLLDEDGSNAFDDIEWTW